MLLLTSCFLPTGGFLSSTGGQFLDRQDDNTNKEKGPFNCSLGISPERLQCNSLETHSAPREE